MKLIKLLVIYYGLFVLVQWVLFYFFNHFDSFSDLKWTSRLITIILMIIYYRFGRNRSNGKSRLKTILAFISGFVLGFFTSRHIYKNEKERL